MLASETTRVNAPKVFPEPEAPFMGATAECWMNLLLVFIAIIPLLTIPDRQTGPSEHFERGEAKENQRRSGPRSASAAGFPFRYGG